MNNSDEKRIWYYPKSGHGFWSVPTIHHGRETALPYPLYHSGVAGIDIICSEDQPGNTNRFALAPIRNSQFAIPNS